jgi:hypothetical protein
MARALARTSDTAGQYISCGNAAALNPQSNMSVACWAYPTSSAVGQTAHMYVTRDGSSSARCYTLMRQAFTGTANRFYCEIFKNNTTGTSLNSTTVGATDTWYHICLTYKFVTDGTSELRLYVNGSQEASSTAAVGPINQQTAAVEIGRRTFSGANYPANARMAEVAIYNRTLSADEVASLADGMTPDKVSPQGLVLYAPLVRDLIDLKGNTLTDFSTTVADHLRVYA